MSDKKKEPDYSIASEHSMVPTCFICCNEPCTCGEPKVIPRHSYHIARLSSMAPLIRREPKPEGSRIVATLCRRCFETARNLSPEAPIALGCEDCQRKLTQAIRVSTAHRMPVVLECAL